MYQFLALNTSPREVADIAASVDVQLEQCEADGNDALISFRHEEQASLVLHALGMAHHKIRLPRRPETDGCPRGYATASSHIRLH